MGIYALIQCDNCGASLSWEHVGKSHIIRWARQKGWSIGNTITCKQCKDRKPHP